MTRAGRVGDHRFVALLRGVNVGGRTVPMRELREAFIGLGYREVRTYIQSGNVLFAAAHDDTALLAEEIRGAIEAGVGHRVTVLVRTPAELADTCAANPYAARTDARSLHVTFLDARPDADALGRLDPVAGAPDEFIVIGREVYVWCASGYGRTVLSNEYFERRLGVGATTRNWRMVTTLAAMSAE